MEKREGNLVWGSQRWVLAGGNNAFLILKEPIQSRVESMLRALRWVRGEMKHFGGLQHEANGDAGSGKMIHRTDNEVLKHCI